MDIIKYELNQAINKISSQEIPFSKEETVNIVNVIKLFRKENAHDLDKDSIKIIDNLPSEDVINNKFTQFDINILYKTLDYLWKKITGEKLSDSERVISNDKDAQNLDGCYWMLPGEILVSGFNHFDAAKKHKGVICSLLNINPIVFEKHLASDPKYVIDTIIRNHGVRVLINRDDSKVYMQCSEKAWPIARNKLRKMYHRKKILRVLDKTKPYEGWDSGIPLIIK